MRPDSGGPIWPGSRPDSILVISPPGPFSRFVSMRPGGRSRAWILCSSGSSTSAVINAGVSGVDCVFTLTGGLGGGNSISGSGLTPTNGGGGDFGGTIVMTIKKPASAKSPAWIRILSTTAPGIPLTSFWIGFSPMFLAFPITPSPEQQHKPGQKRNRPGSQHTRALVCMDSHLGGCYLVDNVVAK